MFARRRSRPGSRRSPTRAPQQVESSFRAFRRCLDLVEEGKACLVAVAPGGRGQGVPLAEGLAGFEMRLREAEGAMPAWRIPEVDEAWQRCRAALRESLLRDQALRLGEVPAGYEQLYGVLGDLMEPLDAFATAADRFRELGARVRSAG